MLAEAERLLCDGGTPQVDVALVCERARVPSGALHAAFGDRDDLLLALFESLVSRLAETVAAACAGGDGWLDGVRRGLDALLARLDARPSVARFLVVDSLAGDAAMLARRKRALSRLAEALEADAPGDVGGALPPPFGAEAVVGAVMSVLHGRLAGAAAPRLRELYGPLVAIVVLPYLGADGARAELLRPAPSAHSGPTDPASRCQSPPHEEHATPRTRARKARLRRQESVDSRTRPPRRR